MLGKCNVVINVVLSSHTHTPIPGHETQSLSASILEKKTKKTASTYFNRVCGTFSGINDLYVHVAVDNEPAKKLYMKSGFVYESDEPAWQARFLDRPRRILLWTGLPGVQL